MPRTYCTYMDPVSTTPHIVLLDFCLFYHFDSYFDGNRLSLFSGPYKRTPIAAHQCQLRRCHSTQGRKRVPCVVRLAYCGSNIYCCYGRRPQAAADEGDKKSLIYCGAAARRGRSFYTVPLFQEIFLFT